MTEKETRNWTLKDGRAGCTWGARHKFRYKNDLPKKKCFHCGAPAPERILKEIETLKAQGEIVEKAVQ